MAIQIKRAIKYGAKLRLALYGPSGSGKTYTALAIAHAIKGEKRVIVIDTERGSASKYADNFPEYDVIELDSFHPNRYIEAIKAVIQSGEYGVLIVDSATHEWDGSKGALELAGQNFVNWATVTPLHNAFVDAMLAADIHIIVTMRAKEEHVMREVEQNGRKRTVVEAVGMEPIQRKGIQYEFDIVGSLDISNTLTVGKTRCVQLKDTTFKPGGEGELVSILQSWLEGTTAPPKAPTYREIFAKGQTKGLWKDGASFYAYINVKLGITVNQLNVQHLEPEVLVRLDKAVDEEQSSAA